ncbi:aurora kinase A-interacting protein [Labrus mixtus]|uniref:aurora kinase A-interacting protein n=1 Tax=Labrus mixtus TaxID=508554 RepID=UPI0029C0FE23|nr:aurora kinase A-interacting protein [Labrus mixtus]XP_060913698.1 aurora kinase A-interacting protein [Labrus mixtus]
MFTSKVVPHLSLILKATCGLQAHGVILSGCVRRVLPAYCSSLTQKQRNYSTAADNTSPPRWVQLEPELEEALVPRKLSVSPLESWLSLRYSLPAALESAPPQEDAGLVDEKVLPPIAAPVSEEGEGSATPLQCKNVLEIRRRMMNRHKYRKLQKRTKFLRRGVMESRGRRKQRRFEEDLKKIWTRAGLKKAPDGWNTPKLFLKQHGNKKD